MNTKQSDKQTEADDMAIINGEIDLSHVFDWIAEADPWEDEDLSTEHWIARLQNIVEDYNKEHKTDYDEFDVSMAYIECRASDQKQEDLT